MRDDNEADLTDLIRFCFVTVRLQINNLRDTGFCIHAMAAAILWVRGKSKLLLNEPAEVAKIQAAVRLAAHQLPPKLIPFCHISSVPVPGERFLVLDEVYLKRAANFYSVQTACELPSRWRR